jgi:hypothetical protein
MYPCNCTVINGIFYICDYCYDDYDFDVEDEYIDYLDPFDNRFDDSYDDLSE